MKEINPIAKEVAEIVSFLESKGVKRYWFQIDGDLGIAYVDIYAFKFGINSRIRVQDSIPLENAPTDTLKLIQKLFKEGEKAIDGKFIKYKERGER